ncbi:MAG: adenylate/guanylate cyclase domain-containing protein [Patescibacteria group bacterium]
MRKKFVYFLVSLVAGGLVFGSYSLGIFSGLENAAEDLLVSPKTINQDIVIVTIDDASISKIGQWPWSRQVFASALEQLNSVKPKVLGVDIVFSEPSRFGEADDQSLATAIENANYPIVFPVETTELTIKKGSAIGLNFNFPLSLFNVPDKSSLGHANIIADKDGIVRRFPLIITDGGNAQVFNAFAYEVAKASGEQIPNESNLQNINRIVFAGAPGHVRRVPFWQIYQGDSLDSLKNKIVLLGVFTSDLHDAKPVPIGKENDMPGVEIQANIVNMLLQGYRLTDLSNQNILLWIFLAALLPAIIFSFSKRSIRPLLYNIILGFLYLLAAIVLFEFGVVTNIIHITLAWAIPTAVIFVYRYFIAEKEKRELKNVFSKYVSKEVVKEILKDPGKVKLGGQEKEITVFFSDIRGFTTLSENTKPQELVKILNRYFTLMTEEVLKYGGVLDKYIGDAIMAFWGAPIDDADSADKAMKASVGMLAKLKVLNEELRQEGKPEINIGIGLYTGPAVVGNIGSELRLNYTAMGDTVNVASRLEGLNKEYKTNIIIGETTKNKLKTSYKFKPLGSATVKGRVEPINIYTIEL